MSQHRPVPPAGHRYHSLDIWRGVACRMVVVFHSAFYVTDNSALPFPQSGAAKWTYWLIDRFWLGVPMFFVISGYCITAASVGSRATVGCFFLRRFRRIYPPAWACLAAAALLLGGLSWTGYGWLYTDSVHPLREPRALTFWQWLGNITLTETWRHHLDSKGGLLLLGHYWSLCYEEQFYAVCGFALLISRRPMVYFSIMLAVTVAVAVIFAIRLPLRVAPVDGWFFDGRWLLFASGIAVYYRAHHAAQFEKVMIDTALIFGTLVAIKYSSINMLAVELRTSLAFALGLGWLWQWDAKLASWRVLSPLSWCGTMCYSLYLTHWPVCKLLSHGLFEAGVRGPWSTLYCTVPLCILVSLGVAYVFLLTVERQFLNAPTHVALEASNSFVDSPTQTGNNSASAGVQSDVCV